MSERKLISTLKGFEPKPNHKVGNTTRLIDRAIQIIFSGHICLVQDHFADGENFGNNTALFNKIIKRIHSEHPVTALNYENSRDKITISLRHFSPTKLDSFDANNLD